MYKRYIRYTHEITWPAMYICWQKSKGSKGPWKARIIRNRLSFG
jgi:hypothetical protein